MPENHSSQPANADAPTATVTLRLVVSNVPDEAAANKIARALVDERLAACVNVLAACRSVYRWQGRIEDESEIPILVKTTADRHEACVQRLAALHPHEVPEIVTLTPSAVSRAYGQWAIDQTV